MFLYDGFRLKDIFFQVYFFVLKKIKRLYYYLLQYWELYLELLGKKKKKMFKLQLKEKLGYLGVDSRILCIKNF